MNFTITAHGMNLVAFVQWFELSEPQNIAPYTWLLVHTGFHKRVMFLISYGSTLGALAANKK